MKIATLFRSACFCAVLAASKLAMATPITGTISFDGIVTTDSGDLANATAFTSIYAIVVPEETGSYAGIPLPPTPTSVTFTPFSFSASGVTPLWQFSYNGATYSFDATSIIIDNQNANFLNLSGAGMANITGYDSTAGTWSITDTTEGGSPIFTFGAATSVPDNSATALLILIGMLGIGLGLRMRPRQAAQVSN